MELQRALRSLAEGGAWQGLGMSVYADTRWYDEAQRERVKVFWAQARGQALGAGVAPEIVAPIDHAMTAILRGPRAPGVALFSGPGAFRALELPELDGQHAAWTERPMLAPLARVIDRCDRSLTAVVSAKRTSIYELAGKALVGKVELDWPDFPGRAEVGGFAQARMARHVRLHLRWALDDVVARLTEAFDREPCAVFICGTPQVASQCHALLPRRLAARAEVLGYLGGNPAREIQWVQARVGARVAEQRLEALRDGEAQIYREAMAGRQGVLGAADVLLALQEGRVHTLYLKDGLETLGAECLRCGALDVKRLLGCAFCGGPVRLGSLVEPMIRLAVRGQARVRFVPVEARPDRVGGLAALLRPNRGPGWSSLGRQSHTGDLAIDRPDRVAMSS